MQDIYDLIIRIPKVSARPQAFRTKSSRRIAAGSFKGGKMKDKIHPDYKKSTITCACGEVMNTSSTKQDIRVEICSSCHPFFTGKQKLLDTAGRVERFKKRYARE